MKKLNKLSNEALRKRHAKILKVQQKTAAFDNEIYDINDILNKRNRAAIFKTCCRILKNHNRNQFAAAAIIADAVINEDYDYFATDDSYEIKGYYTKSGNPVVVWFD